MAQTAVARTEAALAQATAFEASERAHVEGVEEQARAAAEVRSMAERSASLAQQDREAAIEIERAAFARGDLVVEVDVAATQAASEAAARRVSVLRVEEMKAKEPLAAAQASYASAVDRRRTAAFKLAHADRRCCRRAVRGVRRRVGPCSPTPRQPHALVSAKASLPCGRHVT